MTAQHKAWSPSGSFINDDKLHGIVDSALTAIITKLDAVMVEAQGIMNGNGGLTLKSDDYLSGVTFRKAFSLRSTEDTAHVLLPSGFRSWYVNGFRKTNVDLPDLKSADADALFFTLYMRVSAYSMPRRIIVSSVSLHPDMIGRGIWRHIEKSLRVWAKAQFATFEYENVGNPLLLANLMGRDRVSHLIDENMGLATAPSDACEWRTLHARLPTNWGTEAGDGDQDAYMEACMNLADKVAVDRPSPYISAPLDVTHLLQCTALNAITTIIKHAEDWASLAGLKPIRRDIDDVRAGKIHSSSNIKVRDSHTGQAETCGWPLETTADVIPHVAKEGGDFIVDVHLTTDHYDDNVKRAVYGALEAYGLERETLRADKPTRMSIGHPVLAALAPAGAALRIQVFINHMYELTVKV